MSRLLQGVGLAFVAAVWLGLAGPALAVFPPPVKDDGKFFSKEALDKANKKIRAIYEKYKKDVIIETLASLTPDQEKKLKEEGSEKRFFERHALERSRELGLNGVYVMICKSPRYLWVYMDPGTQKTMFKITNREAVVRAIEARFREREFDQGLLAGLDAIEAAFKSNLDPKK